MQDCTIKFDGIMLSRYQCGIVWDANSGYWMIFDGHKGKPSTNGTWLFIDEPRLIEEDMIFKAG